MKILVILTFCLFSTSVTEDKNAIPQDMLAVDPVQITGVN